MVHFLLEERQVQQLLIMVEISKTLTKIVRIIVKYIPFVIGLMYLIQSILFCFGIVIP